jgi:hypothetical protein
MCNGACPPNEVCKKFRGECICEPEQPKPCEETFPECNGPCPFPLECQPLLTAPGCECLPPACGINAAGECGGVCPVPTEVCGINPATTECECFEPTLRCEESPYPVCDGPCPPGELCMPSLDGIEACRCVPEGPPLCEESPFPECGGLCPPPEICVANAASGRCLCEPPLPLCEGSAPMCNGLCLIPEERCAPVPGTDLCECQPPF